jgi:hypothetical protein
MSPDDPMPPGFFVKNSRMGGPRLRTADPETFAGCSTVRRVCVCVCVLGAAAPLERRDRELMMAGGGMQEDPLRQYGRR